MLRRRLERGVEEEKLPDFILIDGGKGQLGVLKMVLDEMGLNSRIDMAGIAKSRVKANVRGRAVDRGEKGTRKAQCLPLGLFGGHTRARQPRLYADWEWTLARSQARATPS